jgi:hypothetical protein
MRNEAKSWVVGLLVTVALLAGVFTLADEQADKAAALDAANKWLALVDDGKYAASWDEAAPYFKDSVDSDKWGKMLKVTRGPLGKLTSRKLESSTSRTSLPGAPDGQYLVIQYQSSFENMKSAVEMVVSMLTKSGQWKVSGYYIKAR